MSKQKSAPSALGVADGLERLEALRLKLCKVGLHPKYHDTPEKAVDAVCEMIAYFRRELADPPADVCAIVLRKYGVEGFTGQDEPRCRLVSFPNAEIRGADERTPHSL